MKAVVQRVDSATVSVLEDSTSDTDQSTVVGAIGTGLVVLLGIANDDTHNDLKKIADKIANLRIFQDQNGKMSKNVQQVAGALLIISQFTLMADTTRGNRPSFTSAMEPASAKALYLSFCEYIRENYPLTVETGQFGANMRIAIGANGPVTIMLST